MSASAEGGAVHRRTGGDAELRFARLAVPEPGLGMWTALPTVPHWEHSGRSAIALSQTTPAHFR